MSATTSIEWTDRTWNPLRGCSRVSEGCRHCYAERVAWRFGSQRGRPYWGLVQMTSQGPKWTGKVQTVVDALEEPLHWREPALIFVNSMSDLFHEDVPDAFIDAVMAVMWLSVRHTYQVLTKRPARARRYFTELAASPDFAERMGRACDMIPAPTTRRPHLCDEITENSAPGWPAPPTMWLGVSAENQVAADERLPELLRTPAALRWLSAEPLLGPIDLQRACTRRGRDSFDGRGLDWVVAGGESGPGARPMHPDWIRDLRDQCKAASVPFLFKQWGAYRPALPDETPTAWVDRWHGCSPMPGCIVFDQCGMSLCGKKAAGRLLDGVLHDAYPQTTTERA